MEPQTRTPGGRLERSQKLNGGLFIMPKQDGKVKEDYSTLFLQHIASLTERSGGELSGLCPFHDDENPSWTGNRHTGLWQCFGCGAKGNSKQFAQRVGGTTLIEVKPKPCEAGELPPANRASKRQTERERERLAKIKTGRWTYLDKDGNPWIDVLRYDPPGKKKFFLQYDRKAKKWTGDEDYNLPSPRPLYNLPSLASADVVLLAEGEKCADALTSLGFTTTATMGGALSADKSDFSPLSGKKVFIWPDNDKAGDQYAEDVAKKLLAVGALPHIIPIPGDKPEGWDSADAIKEGLIHDQVMALFEQAPLYEIPKTLKAISVGDFLHLDIRPREMVLGPIIPTQGLVMVYAARGIGKTHVSLGIAFAVAIGGTFLRWVAPKPRRVLFVDGEMPAVAMQERVRREVQSVGQYLPTLDFLRIITPDLQIHGIPDLSTPEGQATIEEHLDGVELLVLDNLSTLCRSGEENAAESWLPVQQWVLALRRRGISVLLVHHAGKSGAQRGTSRREDVLDTVISLRRPSDYSPNEGARFEVHLEKARGIHGEKANPFDARLEEQADGKAVWTVKDLGDVTRERVAELLKEGLSQRAIGRELGLSVGAVNKHAKKAREDGLVEGGF